MSEIAIFLTKHPPPAGGTLFTKEGKKRKFPKYVPEGKKTQIAFDKIHRM